MSCEQFILTVHVYEQFMNNYYVNNFVPISENRQYLPNSPQRQRKREIVEITFYLISSLLVCKKVSNVPISPTDVNTRG